jgi:tetratricopeptide (TPR) repeat protein
VGQDPVDDGRVGHEPDEAHGVAALGTAQRVHLEDPPQQLRAAGHHVGAGYAVQANLMRNDRVWPAVARAFETTRGDLAERMMAALEAGEAAGGDIRGKQSAALVVVAGERSDRPWERVFELRVADHPRPLAELRRLLRVARAYAAATEGDNHVAAGHIDSALMSYTRAATILPDSATNGELIYWQAVTLTEVGRVDQAIPLFRRAFAQDTSWIELLWRLPRVGLLSADSATIARIVRRAR